MDSTSAASLKSRYDDLPSGSRHVLLSAQKGRKISMMPMIRHSASPKHLPQQYVEDQENTWHHLNGISAFPLEFNGVYKNESVLNIMSVIEFVKKTL
ncbi:hypothetical protein NQ317_013308 [Molorchus minor]|uniref:Uncharacterized protein n=1 Tax=Molorchus minor TaxID=1323400 RepID=A0ABQ9JAK4_9CUCU|nr:hypothetical protein NQ317_013308 [Molorchus minor]